MWQIIGVYPGRCLVLRRTRVHRLIPAGPEAQPPARLKSSPSGVEMVSLPGGEFMMGSNNGNADEAPAHKIKISGFLIDKFEVTHEMFVQAQLPNPSHWQASQAARGTRPLARCQALLQRAIAPGGQTVCDKRRPRTSTATSANGYRLPTEAEWEYPPAPESMAPMILARPTSSGNSRGSLITRDKMNAIGGEKAEPVGYFRPIRKRIRMVRGRLQPDLLQGEFNR